jgi:hypothetical protein
MEYSDGQRDKYTKDKGITIKEKDTLITNGPTVMSITDSGRMTCSGEKECSSKMDNYTQLNMNKIILSAK